MATTKVDVNLIDASGITSSKYLKGDGTWATIAAGGGFIEYTVVTASNSAFELEANTTKTVIEIQSSGGAGGNSNAAGYNGGSGGGGAYARKFLSGLTGGGSGDKLNISIGAPAGIGASGNVTSVAAAGTASFSTITCTGGAGGVSASGTTQGDGGAGGALPTTGDFNIAGGDGGSGAGGQTNQMGGSFYGVHTARVSGANAAGVVAKGYGIGGQSGYGTGSPAGAAGGSAVVIVWEYL